MFKFQVTFISDGWLPLWSCGGSEEAKRDVGKPSWDCKNTLGEVGKTTPGGCVEGPGCTRSFAARELLLHEKSAAREVYCTRFWHPICPDSSKSWRNCLGDGDTGGVRQVQASKPKLQPQDSCGLASPGRTSLLAFGKSTTLAFETGSKTFPE